MALDRNAAKAIVAAYYAGRDGSTPSGNGLRDMEDLIFAIIDGVRANAVVSPLGTPTAMNVSGNAVAGAGKLL